MKIQVKIEILGEIYRDFFFKIFDFGVWMDFLNTNAVGRGFLRGSVSHGFQVFWRDLYESDVKFIGLIHRFLIWGGLEGLFEYQYSGRRGFLRGAFYQGKQSCSFLGHEDF